MSDHPDGDNHHHPEADTEAPIPIEQLIVTKLDAIADQVEFLARLVCPVCGPALIVAQHPDTGPQPRRPTADAG